MISLSEFIVIYLTGGLTFLPIVIYVLFTISSPVIKRKKGEETKKERIHNSYFQSEKNGWIRLTTAPKPKTTDSNVTTLVSGIQSYVQSSSSKRQKELVYAKLKYNTLFIYESDAESECKIIIPVHNYNVSIYPKKEEDQEIFGKTTTIRLTPKEMYTKNNVMVSSKDERAAAVAPNSSSFPDLQSNNTAEFYITCARPVDKEDWYFGLLSATYAMSESPETSHIEKIDTTHFDQESMQSLISTLTQDVNNREIQWLNAILGRVFLGLYKTKEMETHFEEKILKKINNVKRPSFLGEISVESVNIGQSIPFITQPKLLSMTPEGDLIAEASLDYAGGLRVVIMTSFHWTYSSLMKPIILPLVLSVTLKSIKGKFQLKIKPPPTNRLWFGFYSMPDMDWEITPIVSDKQIKLSMVRNAIQSKIKELIMEVLVLPNMDDIPFCHSDGKGGIFGERVSKPSSSYSSPEIILNKTTAPKFIVTEDDLDLSMRKTSPAALFDTQELQKGGVEVNLHCGPLRTRGYSSPDLPRKPDTIQQQTKDDYASSPIEISSDTLLLPSFETDRPSQFGASSSNNNNNISNSRIRKRHSSPAQNGITNEFGNDIKAISTAISVAETIVTTPGLPEDLSLQSCSDTTVVNTNVRSMEATPHPERNLKNVTIEKDVDSSSISGKSTSSTTTSKSKLFSRISQNIKFEKSIETKKTSFQTKKNAFYNMAGSMFKKNNGVTKQIREERTRELEEIHQRKMMTIFDKDNSLPPPLPPRKSSVHYTLEDYQSSFDDDEEEEEEEAFARSLKEYDITNMTDSNSKITISCHSSPNDVFQVQHEKHRFSL